jgi:Holliday junction resolvase-like predicted endonuclease
LQGDAGEAIAASWLVRSGYGVWLPFGHSADFDLIAQFGQSLQRVQVKTSTVYRNRRWEVAVCTRGGNQTWNGISKHLDQTRYDFLFVVVADWRCWFIPSSEISAGSCILLGGPKYAKFEVTAGGQ